ncbi:MAG TPA: peptidase, partial [Firmicutes bacterium]|nr:peptidase [Bacillota bacterium]
YSIGNTIVNYFAGYRVQHRFGLSVQTPGSWLGDELKNFLISLVLLVPLLLLFRVILTNAPAYWWLYVGIVFVFISVILVNLSPVLIMPLFYKFTPLKDEKLKAQLE